MQIAELRGKLVAVLLFIEREGEADNIRWFASEPRERDGKLEFERPGESPFTLPLDALEDIRFCSPDQMATFEGCEYVLPLTIKNLPEEGIEGIEFTGLTLGG